MFRFRSHRLVFCFGVALWAIGTIVTRVAGQYLLSNGAAGTLLLYGGSFAVMALLVPKLFDGARVRREDSAHAYVLLSIPTLTLDPFTCAFFSSLFPNVPAGAAGVFGGWMLACCAGAAVGVLRR
jgi:hypothetical protein